MKSCKKSMLLYAVTDRAWTKKKSLYEQVNDALKGGVTCVQIREKELNYDDFLMEAIEIGSLCKQFDVPFIVNDNIDIAIKSNADGVHIGQHDMSAKEARKLIGENKILGVSVQTVKQAIAAENDGADYLGVGAVFNTSTKEDADAVSPKTLKEISAATSLPVVAIGGINETNIPLLKDCNIDGVAVVSAIFNSPDIEKQCKKLYELCLRTFNNGGDMS